MLVVQNPVICALTVFQVILIVALEQLGKPLLALFSIHSKFRILVKFFQQPVP